jgi:hypothetical protein
VEMDLHEVSVEACHSVTDTDAVGWIRHSGYFAMVDLDG